MQEVKFSINPDLGMFENGFSEKEVEEVANLRKERLGYFEQWGYRLVKDDGQTLQQSVGIVIEAETGKVYQVLPGNITFPKNNAASFL